MFGFELEAAFPIRRSISANKSLQIMMDGLNT